MFKILKKNRYEEILSKFAESENKKLRLEDKLYKAVEIIYDASMMHLLDRETKNWFFEAHEIKKRQNSRPR